MYKGVQIVTYFLRNLLLPKHATVSSAFGDASPHADPRLHSLAPCALAISGRARACFSAQTPYRACVRTLRCLHRVRCLSSFRPTRRSNLFKGDFKVTTQSLLGKAEMKKLRERLLDEFPLLSKKMLNTVLPKDVEVNLLKCSNGTQLYVPGSDNPPAFFDDGFGGVYPTLFTLWKLPPFMPELVTHGPVSKFLLPKERSAGADMMLPGVIVPDEGLGSFREGQHRCVRVDGNEMPFAVGKMLVSDTDIVKGGMKGKGMAVLHVYRDSVRRHDCARGAPLACTDCMLAHRALLGARALPVLGVLGRARAASAWGVCCASARRVPLSRRSRCPQLWTYGGRKVPNEGFGADAISPAEAKSAASAAGADEEEDEEDDDEEGGGGGGERRSGDERMSRTSGPIDPIDEMAPDALMEYCFYAVACRAAAALLPRCCRADAALMPALLPRCCSRAAAVRLPRCCRAAPAPLLRRVLELGHVLILSGSCLWHAGEGTRWRAGVLWVACARSLPHAPTPSRSAYRPRAHGSWPSSPRRRGRVGGAGRQAHTRAYACWACACARALRVPPMACAGVQADLLG